MYFVIVNKKKIKMLNITYVDDQQLVAPKVKSSN